VVQPQTEVARVRRHLVALDFRIAQERLVRQSGRFYFAIAAERSGCAGIDPHPRLATDDLLEAGPCLVRDAAPDLVEYWSRQRTRCESIVRRATSGRSVERARRHMERAGRILRALGSPPVDRRTPGGGVL
jgi:tRNA A22 N-methylase